MGLGIFDPLLWGEVGDLGGLVFDAESAEMSALTGVGILETGRGILLPLTLPSPDWSDSGRSPGVVVVAVGGGVEIVVERLLWF